MLFVALTDLKVICISRHMLAMLASFLLLSIEIEHTHTHLQLIRRYSLYLYYSSTSFLRLETKCLSVITCKKKSCSYMDGNGFRQRYVLLAYRQIEIDIDRQIDSEQTNIKSDRYYLLTKLQSKQMVQNNIGYGLLHFVYESNLDVCLMMLMMLMHLSIYLSRKRTTTILVCLLITSFSSCQLRNRYCRKPCIFTDGGSSAYSISTIIQPGYIGRRIRFMIFLVMDDRG